MGEAPYKSTMQRGRWVLFRMLSHLTTKEHPFVFTVTWCPWIWPEANNWTSSNKPSEPPAALKLCPDGTQHSERHQWCKHCMAAVCNEDNLDNSDRLSSQSVLLHTLLHCTHLVFVLYKDVHFDGAHTRLECTQDLAEVNWTSPRTVHVGKYGRMLIVPAGSNQGNTVVN